MTSLERCCSDINQTTNNNDSLTPKVVPPNASQNGDSYASILKKVRTVGVKNVCKDTSDDASANNSSESSSFCVFANNISREDFKSPVTFRQKICTVFPCLKISKLYQKSNGIVCLFFNDVNEYKSTSETWGNHFSESSLISFEDQQKRNQKFSILLRDVPSNYSESKYSSVQTANRFIKNGTPLNLVKVEFNNECDFQDSLCNGFTIDNLFLPAEKFVNLSTPIQCYSCFKFGHTTRYCTGRKTCKNCGSSDHATSDCSKKTTCYNCKGNHYLTDKKCPRCVYVLSKMNL